MRKIMTYETLRFFTYSNDELISGEIRGIVLDFKGLGSALMVDGQCERGEMFAQKGIVYLMPYNNPWNWMNAQAVEYTGEILDVIKARYSLSDDVPVVASGGSMGGLCALMYTRYANVTPVACVANCPVCDLVFHYTERPDLPRTLYSALWASGEESIDAALASRSPLHQIDKMPRTKYVIFHCTADEAVNIDSHSEKFVSAMRAEHDITYVRVPGRGHCDLDETARSAYDAAIISAILDE